MQLTQKHIISISVVAILAIVAYFIVQHNTPSQSDGVNTSTGANTAISQSGIETDTGIRLETVANSGTSWGMSPFGSGKPLIEVEKSVFQKPNTEWKTRTLSGVTYVFGEGNPKEVAIAQEKIKEYMNTVNADTGGAPHGYVTSQSEKALKVFLENPSLPYFIEKCHKQIDWYGNQRSYQEWEKYPQKLNLDDIMYIDSKTGFKEFRYQDILNIIGTFNYLDNPIATHSEKVWPQCLLSTEYEQYFIPLQNQASEIYRIYSDPASHM